MANNPIRINQYNLSIRLIWKIFLTAVFALCLAGAIYVPFLYESQTMRYQLGMSRNMLLTGHIMGTAAGALLFFQLILISRFKFLDRVFSINRLLWLHRINATVILFLVILHLILILSALGTEVIAPEFSQWPEYTGLLMLIIIAGAVFSGLFREAIRLKYHFWIFFHRIFSPIIILLLCIHVYFVSKTFHYDSANTLILCFFGACFLLYLILRLKRLRICRYAYRVDNAAIAANSIHTLELFPLKGRRMIYAPGQFAFLKIRSHNISFEEHPFTISSSPSRPPRLQFTIRESGDWTSRVKEITAGAKAYIEGPFGIFGHLDFESMREIVMIAGGIGITPMLSILRYLADKNPGRKITLVWSNRTQKEVVYPDEFRVMEGNMPGLTIKYVFTREKGHGEDAGRLNRDGLEKLLVGCGRESIILLCGPPLMMTQVRNDIVLLGFPGKSIIEERFSL